MKAKKKSLDEMMAAIPDRTPSLNYMYPEPYTEAQLEIIRRYNKREYHRNRRAKVKNYILKNIWSIIMVILAMLSIILILILKQ